jgi:hypothetical protein
MTHAPATSVEDKEERDECEARTLRPGGESSRTLRRAHDLELASGRACASGWGWPPVMKGKRIGVDDKDEALRQPAFHFEQQGIHPTTAHNG